MELFQVSPNARWRLGRHLEKNSNSDISAADHPIYCVFGSRMGFSSSADRMALNFKPNFKFSRLKNFGGTPVPVGVCASKAWSISSACKNMRAEI